MKFLFIVPRYHINLHYMVKALKKHSHEVEMFALYKFSAEEYSALQPKILGYAKLFLLINHFFNKRSGDRLTKNNFELKYGFPPIIKFYYLLIKESPDVLVIKNIENLYSLLALIIGRILGKKIIVLLQIPKFREKPKSNSVYIIGKLFKAKVVTPLLGDTSYKNNNSNLFYIPFTIEVNDFEKKYFTGNKINIICVGKLQKRKDQLILAQAINELKSSYNLALALIGQKDEKTYIKDLIKYIKDNNLRNIVHIKSDLPHKEVLNEYKKNDLFILPSWHEAAAFSLLEAMSCKLPVISSDDNGTKCYIKEGENGYIFKHKNLEDLIERIKLIIADRENIIKMGEASFQLVQENYSLENFYQKFIKICS